MGVVLLHACAVEPENGIASRGGGNLGGYVCSNKEAIVEEGISVGGTSTVSKVDSATGK